jgi:hypothetical protein
MQIPTVNELLQEMYVEDATLHCLKIPEMMLSAYWWISILYATNFATTETKFQKDLL